jgi:hypothetical protein
MLVFARRSLVGAADRSGKMPNESMLLLEGSWPDGSSGDSLDAAIDGRFAALDADAEQVTDAIIAAAGRDPSAANFAELNALRLRYAVVKWLRPIAWRRTQPPDIRREPVRLVVESPRDAEYETLFRQLALADGFSLAVESPHGRRAAPPIAIAKNPFWRRVAGRALAGRSNLGRKVAAPRVLLSGNPRLLDPVCGELVRQGATVAWLYDRFSFGCFRRWRRRGVAQLVCNSSLGRVDRFSQQLCPVPIPYQGIDLAPVANAWFDDLRKSLAPSQDRLWSEVGRHVDAFRPTHIVVDEDATPQPRAAILHGRRIGAASTVVQHGICGVRFGFAPLLADRFCAWDEGSRKQMEAWGVATRAIAVTGSPYQDRVAEQARDVQAAFAVARMPEAADSARPRILLIGTIPPRDDRPDSAAYHLNSRNYELLLQAALTAVAEIPHDELAIRNHPRSGVDSALMRLLAATPGLRHRDTSLLPIADDLAMSDVVLSFPSSGALDAVRLGKPVIQLAPSDSHAVAPAEWYGFFGTAGTVAELRQLLAGVLATLPDRRAVRPSPADQPGAVRHGAAGRIVDALLQPTDEAEPSKTTTHASRISIDAEAIR